MKQLSRTFVGFCGLTLLALGLLWIAGTSDKTRLHTAKSAVGDISTLSHKESRASLKIDSPSNNGRLTISDPKRAFPGFTTYAESGTERVLLLNMQGETVHTWHVDAMRARLLPSCNLLVIHGTKYGARNEPWRTLKYTVREYDWEGGVAWEYTSKKRIHHDVQRLANGNTLFPLRTVIPKDLVANLADPARRNLTIRSDNIIEVTSQGDRAWFWEAHRSLDVNNCGRQGCNGADRTDWTHINTTAIIPENKWYEQGDKRFQPGNLMLMLRNWSTALIIDKKSGDPVWEYEGDYNGGISGGHEVQMIEKGLPGEGNILIFDNGRKIHEGESYVIEINPVTKEIVWIYENGTDFFSHAAGSMQRFPNGNTLISEDVTGRVFEVTPDREIVWEYRGDLRIARAQR
ncbi:MAG: aryl-sulfate sulfotransferase, partial [Bdellovibrionales bacterium]|nr:aryl-sulfate sulfotransferase [Bdellovibrionales bacterium]